MQNNTWFIYHEDYEDENDSFVLRASSQRKEVSLRSGHPGLGSVQKLVGLDNDEINCLEDSFDFIVLVTSSGTTIASSVYGNFWTKKEN